jgi:hypothetical protein
MSRPTEAQASALLFTMGARLAAGPWREEYGGRWVVPARTYMGSQLEGDDPAVHRLPDVVIAPSGAGWKLDREAPRVQHEQQEPIYADARRLT